MTFNNLNDLFKKIENDIQDTMRNEVADTVETNMAKAIQTSVYSVYSPEYYNRRMNNGGLSDTHNMKVTEIQNGVSGLSARTEIYRAGLSVRRFGRVEVRTRQKLGREHHHCARRRGRTALYFPRPDDHHGVSGGM